MNETESGAAARDVRLVVLGRRPEGIQLAGRRFARLAASELEDTSRCPSALLAVVSAPVLDDADPLVVVETAARRGLELVLLAERQGSAQLVSWLAAGVSTVATPQTLAGVIVDRLGSVALCAPPCEALEEWERSPVLRPLLARLDRLTSRPTVTAWADAVGVSERTLQRRFEKVADAPKPHEVLLLRLVRKHEADPGTGIRTDERLDRLDYASASSLNRAVRSGRELQRGGRRVPAA